jgi:hypothetical protein
MLLLFAKRFAARNAWAIRLGRQLAVAPRYSFLARSRGGKRYSINKAV